MRRKTFLSKYPSLSAIVKILDEFLQKEHPNSFGLNAKHPILPVKRFKILHDNIWGTNKFSWQELAIIDSPVFQRLRDIHQVGLAYQVYVCARHTRFEHCLGVVTISSRIFDSLLNRQRSVINNVVNSIAPQESEALILKLRQELRLAALLHDIGHCIHSHTSEQVYENLGILKAASDELTEFVGKEKGAAETIAFCLALTESISELLKRTEKRLVGEATFDEYNGAIDFINVGLMIVGRAAHPFLQFMGDIISSAFDADKIDYLMRDAVCAGLPLRFDIDRYLFSLEIRDDVLTDGERKLHSLYELVSNPKPEVHEPAGHIQFQYYDTYRLRLPERAMNTVEQIVICKLMLYNYIYHHQKVRASEGLLRRMLERICRSWVDRKESEETIFLKFVNLTDSSLYGSLKEDANDAGISDYPYRITNRLLPREIYCLNGAAASHAEGTILKNFFTDLQSRSKRPDLINELEMEIGKQLIALQPDLGSVEDIQQVLFKTGVWIDIPKPPKFEDVDKIIIKKRTKELGISFGQVFPIREWTDAYQHFRYPVRIYSFSEYAEEVKEAAKRAMKIVIKIQGEEFYNGVCRNRSYS